MSEITKENKEASKLTSEEWKEWTMTVWNIANVSDAIHPAVFPVEIPRRLLKMFSFYGETVLDPFSGTGTTGVAAITNGRNYIGFETNTEYYELSQERLKKTAEEENIRVDSVVNIYNKSCTMMDTVPDNIRLFYALKSAVYIYHLFVVNEVDLRDFCKNSFSKYPL